ncbi:MAG: hypothetical protein KME20_18100 [Kaiparowitsia implicata GSE-PSE-MK54-09C]|jgi:hypothetical protein|nr:hypothetical protein [Kaiparowitsia implicata GSE-PSE-MK54-09C]
MFDLFKNIGNYQQVPPYASELYGVYQPLLGWQSSLTKKWIQHGGSIIDPRVKGILDKRILSGLQTYLIDNPLFGEPLQPGTGKSPYTVSIAKDLNSEILNLVRVKVQSFVDNHEGRLPEGEEWRQVIDINNLLDQENGDLRKANDIYKERLNLELAEVPDELKNGFYLIKNKEYFELLKYESQIAAFLLFFAEGQPGYDPNDLKKLFVVNVSPPLNTIFKSTDPLASIDPGDKSGVLSPVGLVHLFRQYFFDLGTFLGEPVEHIWLSPGTTIELIEVSTRKTTTERSFETFSETINRAERSSTLKDELSDAVKDENQNSTKLGVSQSNTVNLYVYQGTVSTNFGIESTRKNSREATHKQNREQNEKLSSEIKQNFKSIFKTVTETTDTRSRRHVIQNPSEKLINYELRRKMRRVGVQIQDVGIGLCWQVFIDEPGKNLGLPNLVHVAAPTDLEPQPNQNETAYPPDLLKVFDLKVTWLATTDDKPRRANLDKGFIPIGVFPLPVQPDSGYEVEMPHNGQVNLSVTSYSGRDFVGPPFAFIGKLVSANQIEVGVVPGPKGRIEWSRNVNFALIGELKFVPTSDVKKQIDEANQKIREERQSSSREKARLTKEAFFKAAKERIELASEVKPRPSWDLREEERTVVYRELIKRLMLDSWEVSEGEEQD